MSDVSEDDIEKMAWELETRMQEIRRDPRAALTAGLAKIRSTMLAEYKADWEKRHAEVEAMRARIEAKLAETEARLV